MQQKKIKKKGYENWKPWLTVNCIARTFRGGECGAAGRAGKCEINARLNTKGIGSSARGGGIAP